MGSTSHSKGRINRALGELSLDVPFALVVVVASSFVAVLDVVPTVQALVGIPVLLFLPGYALLLALFPAGSSDAPVEGPSFGRFEWQPNLSLVERFALAFGMSVALLPVVGLTLLWTGVGLNTAPVIVALSAVIVVGLAVGETRRRRLPESERFHVPIRRWYADVVRSFDQPSRIDSLLNVALAFAILLAVASLSYALVAPGTGESYSSLSLLTQGADGEFVAADYPEALVVGEQTELFVSIENAEGEATSYTLVAELQRVERVNGETTVVERQVLGSRTETVADGETWRTRHTFAPVVTGEDLRLTYFLYEGDAPAEPSTETAYRSAYVWVTVTEEPTDGADAGDDAA
ncbi:DUF1616 domain-containing protein [Haloferax marisrubri]|uniref:DUF1616 domain-containing protein n=1 Tax=Haloferax marisrubri TaxID=1544719 RepID=A0A2P4NSX7_9EURY|nr:DUF1616 domain-containing protein [Haloferax marisrubri]POG56251.1 DUF1616 domain-containing protein [Haloferax marisrubri]